MDKSEYMEYGNIVCIVGKKKEFGDTYDIAIQQYENYNKEKKFCFGKLYSTGYNTFYFEAQGTNSFSDKYECIKSALDFYGIKYKDTESGKLIDNNEFLKTKK